MPSATPESDFEVTIEDKLYPWTKPTIAHEIRDLAGIPDGAEVVRIDLVNGTEQPLHHSEVHELPRLEPGKGIVKRTAFRRA